MVAGALGAVSLPARIALAPAPSGTPPVQFVAVPHAPPPSMFHVEPDATTSYTMVSFGRDPGWVVSGFSRELKRRAVPKRVSSPISAQPKLVDGFESHPCTSATS